MSGACLLPVRKVFFLTVQSYVLCCLVAILNLYDFISERHTCFFDMQNVSRAEFLKKYLYIVIVSLPDFGFLCIVKK